MTSDLPYLAEDGLKWTYIIHGDTYSAISSANASNLNGRAVMITGAARGVGRAAAISCARAGASCIVAADLSPLEDLEDDVKDAAQSNGKPPPKTVLLELDITDRAKVQDTARTVARACADGLDLLINNAGRFEQYVPFLDSDPDSYWKTWEVNLGGTFNVARHFLPLLLEKKNGLKTMINVSSIGAHRSQGASSYRTTKLALLRWTEFLNADYGEQGLLAYCVHPGAILTKLGKGMPKEAHPNLTDKTELPADTMVWLAQERREWLAGRYVSCCWDMPELIKREDEIVMGDKLKVRMSF